MNQKLSILNRASISEASEILGECCGCRSWIERMIAARPFDNRRELSSDAERLWWKLSASNWLEAFAAHPRLGEETLPSGGPSTPRSGWSSQEQQSVKTASFEIKKQLAMANFDYETTHGFVFLVFATGKSAEEMLELCLRRQQNSTEDEIRLAAAEQIKITLHRLEKFLS